MNSRFWTTFSTKNISAVFLSLLLCQSVWSQSTSNQMITFEGTLTDTSGNAVNLDGQDLSYYISVKIGADTCVLFAESSNVSGDAEGAISHRFGTGSAMTSPIAFNHTLSSSVFSGNTNGKTLAGNVCSAVSSDTRYADVYSTVLNVNASIQLGSVPYAQQAMNASLLNGKSDTDFLLASSVTGGSSGQVLSRSGTNGFSWINLPASTGFSSIDLSTASATGILAPARLPSYTGDVLSSSGSSTMSVIALRGVIVSPTMPSAGQTLAYNGTQWAPMSVGSLATQSSVDLTFQAIGTLQQAQLPAFSGDVFSSAGNDALTVTGIQGHSVANTTPISGQIMSFNGSQWVPTNPNYVRSGGDTMTGFYVVDGSLGVVSTTATNYDVLPLFTIRRQTSNGGNATHGLGSMILFDAENSAGSTINQTSIVSRWTNATTATEQSQLEFQTRFNTTMSTRMTITADGKIGIGTTLPDAKLDVQGKVSSDLIQLRSPASLPPSCTSTEEGTQRYNNIIKTMEYCDGSNWQGVNGVTYCDTGYTLVGSAGTISAFCIDNSTSTPTTYTTASGNCRTRNPSRKTQVTVCSIEQFDTICESNINLSSFNGVTVWTSNGMSGVGQNYTANYQYMSTCHLNYMGPTDSGRSLSAIGLDSNNYNYRCCYQ